MAEVTVNLTGYFEFTSGTFVWTDDVPIGSVFALNNMAQTLDQLTIGVTGTFGIGIIGTDDRFTAAFESTGLIIITASDGETLEVMIADADMSEPYNWTPSNSAEVITFNTHVRSLTDQDATLTLTDGPPGVATIPDVPATPSLTVNSETQITAVGIAPDDGGEAITSYDWRHKRTADAGWTDRLGETNLTQIFTGLDAGTEYEFQFRATNSIGDSDYSLSAAGTTDAATGTSITVDIGNGSSSATLIIWSQAADLGAMFDADGVGQTLSQVFLYYSGSQAGDIGISLTGPNDRFTPAFETNGRITITLSDGETLEVMIADAAMSEPYFWLPSNSAEVIAFGMHVVTLSDSSATLTLRIGDPPVVSEPSTPAAPTLTVAGQTQITAVGIAPDDGGAAITGYDWRHKKTADAGWTDRLDQTNLTQVFTSLDVGTEYEFQFRATNSVGNSDYSLAATATTGAVPSVALSAQGLSLALSIGQPTLVVGDVPDPAGTVTVDLTGFQSSPGFAITWDDDQVLGADFAASGLSQTLEQLVLFDSGGVNLLIVGVDNRFTPAFEATGRIIVTASDGETLDVRIADVDMSEPYSWVPSNAVEVTAFVLHVRGLTDNSATLTLMTDVPTIPDVPTTPTLIVHNQTQITAVGVAPDDGGASISSYDWRHKRTADAGWTDRLDETNLTQLFTGLDAGTEYEVQFRATNSVGNSVYSLSATATTNAAFSPSTPAAPTLTVNSDTQITAVGVVPYDGGATITGYDWRYKRTADAGWTDRLDETNLTQVFTGLDLGTEYEFQFRATNSVGDSGYSPSATATTGAVPDTVPDRPNAPTLTVNSDTRIAAVGAAPDDGGATISSYDWRHKKTVDSLWIGRFDETSLIQVFTGLDVGTEYEFQFRATNSVGNSNYSPSATATPNVKTIDSQPIEATMLTAVAQYNDLRRDALENHLHNSFVEVLPAGVKFQSQVNDPTKEGEVRLVGNSLKARLGGNVRTLNLPAPTAYTPQELDSATNTVTTESLSTDSLQVSWLGGSQEFPNYRTYAVLPGVDASGGNKVVVGMVILNTFGVVTAGGGSSVGGTAQLLIGGVEVATMSIGGTVGITYTRSLVGTRVTSSSSVVVSLRVRGFGTVGGNTLVRCFIGAHTYEG